MAATTDSEALRKAMEATTRAFVNSYSDATAANDVSLNTRFLAPDCTRLLRPASYFKFRGRDSVFNNAEYEKVFALDLAIGGMMNVTVADVTIDVQGRRSAASSYWDMVFKDGESVGMEIAWFLEFDGEGKMITRVVECVDPWVIGRTIEHIEKNSGEGGSAAV